MTTTRHTFIRRLQGGGDATWQQLDSMYRPLIVGWLRRLHLNASDIDDVGQEIMLVVMRRIDDFDHNGRVGAFRNWLRTITANTTRAYLRKHKRESSSEEAMQMVEGLEDPASGVSRLFDRDHNRYVLRELMSRVAAEFEPKTMDAFRLNVLEQVDAKEAAARLKTTPRAVYIAKSRVLRRLREEAADWFDDLIGQ